MRILRQREVRQLAQGHTASKMVEPGLELKGQTPEVSSEEMKEWIVENLAWRGRESCREEMTFGMPGRARGKR